MLDDLLTKYKRDFTDYTNLRAHHKQIICVVYSEGEANVYVNRESMGVSSGVFASGAYGFAALPSYDEDSVKRVLKLARDNALTTAAFRSKPMPPMPLTESGSIMRTFDYRRVLPYEACELARQLGKYAEAKKPGLKCDVAVNCDVTEKLLVISNGYDYHNIEDLPSVSIDLSLEENGRTLEAHKTVYPKRAMYHYVEDPSELFAEIDAMMDELKEEEDKAAELEAAVFAEGGEWDCVLMPSLTTLLAHEAIGHTLEADTVLEPNSMASRYMGKAVASPLVSLTDFHSATCNGMPGLLDIPVDDEGVKCIDAPIIKDGILMGAMTDRRTAVELGMPMTGNARASEYFNTTVIRMRNTCFHPGTSKLEDMIASIDHGYMLTEAGGGGGGTMGEFNMTVAKLYEIRGGEVGKLVKPTTVAGIAQEALMSVDMVSDNYVPSDHCGTCGKKNQQIHTTGGGPAFKMKLNFAGK